MATHAVSGSGYYSGVTTTTDTDILTLTGVKSAVYAGGLKAVAVRNCHATATLIVSTNAKTATGTQAVKLLPGVEATIPVIVQSGATVEVQLTGSAACDYYVVGRYTLT